MLQMPCVPYKYDDVIEAYVVSKAMKPEIFSNRSPFKLWRQPQHRYRSLVFL
jgi:hypothetical protein